MRSRRRWIYVALGVVLVAVAAGIGLALSVDDADRARVTEQAGVIRSTQKAVKRFRVAATGRLAQVFVAAGRRAKQAPPNPYRVPRTPDDPTAEPARSSDSPPVEEAALGSKDEAPNRVTISRRTLVRRDASHIAEPHIATDGKRVLVTWNWGAAASLDAGENFRYLNPETEAGTSTPLPFCCDQLAYYSPRHDLWIWLLQYRGEGNVRQQNIVRLAYAVGGDAFDRRGFDSFDLAALDIAGRRSQGGRAVDGNAYLDFSRIAATNDHLFVTINMFATVREAYSGSVVVRVPLSELAARKPHAEWWLTDRRTAGLTSGATDTMHFATHRTDATLTVCRWSDDADTPACADVEHSAHPSPRGAYLCQRVGAPASSDWCQRLTNGKPNQDDRPLSGWVADGVIGFSWNARQDPANGFPYPFTMVVRIDEDKLTLVDEPRIWHPERAYQYAAIFPNARGDLGAVALMGGGARYQTCVALVRDAEPSSARWEAEIVDASDSDAVAATAGDYLGIFPSRPDSNAWVGACMTLHGGGEEANVEIRFVSFGREQDLS